MIMTESAVGYPARLSTWAFWAAGALGLLASVVLPTFGLGSAGWICAAASVVGITLYTWSAALPKIPSQLAQRPGAADAAASEG